MVSDVKVTVMKCMTTEEVWGSSVPIKVEGLGNRCPKFKEGQEFVIPAANGDPPAGFCGWAFSDIQRDITLLRFGGNNPWAEEGKFVSCCTDALRPVFFKLERVSK